MAYYRNLFKPGMLLELKKEHPCGSRIWEIVRVGALIRLRCRKCGHCLDVTPFALRRAVIEEVRQ